MPTSSTKTQFGKGGATRQLSRRTQMTRPNGLKSIYTYDNLSRLLSVLHQSGSTTLDGAAYTVDNAGNRTSKTDQLAGVTSNYTYDPIYELTQVTQGANTTESYTGCGLYLEPAKVNDPVGNRLSSLGVSSYTNNTSNELTSTSNATYTYDSNGNLLSKTDSTGTTNYTWDFENRLTSVALPGSGGTVTFRYDPFGRRIYKSSSSGTSVYAYDGDNLVEETNAAGVVAARYSQTQNIDEPLAMLRGGATSYYHADGLGSVTSLTNASGAIAQTYTFDSFGKQTNSTGSLTNPFQYTARESDPETGLYYYRARYYDQAMGRFIVEDQMQFWAGYNFYAYVGNKPIEFNDATGLFPTKFHYDLTYDAARAAFGPKCEPIARIIAQANADQDALHGIGQHIKFAIGVGDGWSRKGIHFGGGVDQALADGFKNCDDKALGKGLHGVQDDLSHTGAYSSPFVHYTTSFLSYVTLGVGGLNPADSLSNFAGVNAASDATNAILRQYQRKCLNCCAGGPR